MEDFGRVPVNLNTNACLMRKFISVCYHSKNETLNDWLKLVLTKALKLSNYFSMECLGDLWGVEDCQLTLIWVFQNSENLITLVHNHHY